MLYRSLAILAAIGLVPAALAPASAQTLEITVVGAPPPAVTFVGTFKDRVVPAIDKRLAESGKGFDIEWTHAYAFTLAKFNEVFETVEEGIAGAGLILKNFEPSNLPLEAYAVHMPFSGITRDQIAAIDAKLRETVPELNQAYEKHNQLFITSGVNDSMHLFTKFPVTRVEDLKNRKLGSSGTFAQWLRGTGAVTVDSSMNQSYTNIKNGVYEGYPIGVILSFVYKTYSAAPYFTRVNFGPTITSGITFNTDVWKKIPAHARQIIREEAAKWVGYQNALDAKKRTKFLAIMKKKGVKFSELSAAERRRWASTMPNIAQEWARRLDKRGHPGTRLMKAYMDELRARKIEVARHWDRN